MSDNTSNGIGQVGAATIGAIGNISSSYATSKYNEKAAKKQQEYTQANMILQNKMNRENYEYERANNISDLLNSTSREIEARKRAGLSAVDANSDAQGGVPQASIQGVGLGAAPSYTPMQNPFSVSDILAALQVESQIALNKANADKAKVDADKGKTDTEIANERWSIEKQRLGERIDAEVNKIVADANLSEERVNEVRAQVDVLKKSIDKTDFDMQQAQRLNDKSIEKMDAEITSLVEGAILNHEKANYQRIANKFAEYGIGIAASDIQALAALVVSGKGESAAKSAVGFVKDILSGLIKGVKDSVGDVVQGAGDVVQGAGQSVLDWFTSPMPLPKKVTDTFDNRSWLDSFNEWKRESSKRQSAINKKYNERTAKQGHP